MSDFNARIIAVDAAMDAVAYYQQELSDIRAHICFDMRSLSDKLDRQILHARREMEHIQSQIDAAQGSNPENTQEAEKMDALYRQLHLMEDILQELEQLMVRSCAHGSALLNQFLDISAACSEQSEDALRFMGRYIHDLNLICGREANRLGTYRAPEGYYVCVIDASRYPSTAEHIRATQNAGCPGRLTLDRANSSLRRADSLRNKPARREFDRDEFPMAIFKEGGLGADVAYLEGSDNRGAGSYIAWQLRGIPDGAEVQFRIVW